MALPLLCPAPLTVEARPLGTDVSGTIDVDTTWTAAGSPYRVTNSVTVLEDVTLTIEPGIEALFGNYNGIIVNLGEQRVVDSASTLHYTINFENMPTANACSAD